MANPIVLFDENSNGLKVLGVQNQGVSPATYINNAVVTATLKDRDRRNLKLASGTWPVTLSYVAGSNGNYLGALASTIGYPTGENGYAVLNISGDGYAAEFECPCTFAKRTKP